MQTGSGTLATNPLLTTDADRLDQSVSGSAMLPKPFLRDTLLSQERLLLEGAILLTKVIKMFEAGGKCRKITSLCEC